MTADTYHCCMLCHDGQHLPLLHAAPRRPTLTIAACCFMTADTYHCSMLCHDGQHLPLLHAAPRRPTLTIAACCFMTADSCSLHSHQKTESRIMKNSPPQSDRRHPLTEMTGLPEPSNDSACTSQHNSHVP